MAGGGPRDLFLVGLELDLVIFTSFLVIMWSFLDHFRGRAGYCRPAAGRLRPGATDQAAATAEPGQWASTRRSSRRLKAAAAILTWKLTLGRPVLLA